MAASNRCPTSRARAISLPAAWCRTWCSSFRRVAPASPATMSRVRSNFAPSKNSTSSDLRKDVLMWLDPQVIHSLPTLVDGWLLTVELALLGAAGSLVFGHVAFALQLVRHAPLRWAARLYISFMRGTPSLV